MKNLVNQARRSRPCVWHVAAAFQIPGGIEAHVLHYATEMRNHGFDTEVVVFKPLPRDRHRFLSTLIDRGIRIRSLEDLSRPLASRMATVLFGPWFLYTLLVKRRRPNPAHFRIWLQRRASFRELERLLAQENPDIIHIFGRLHHDVWSRFPTSRTIFHEMMTGTVDRHWAEYEMTAFRAFAEKTARYFAPGEGVAANVKREFGIQRRIDPIYTMCPDEAGGGSGRWPVAGGSSDPDVKPPHGTEHKKHRTSNAEHPTSNEEIPPTLRRSALDVECSTFGFSEVLPPSTFHLPNALRFGVLCRFTGQKGIRYLLDALKLYRDRHGDVEFTFAGSGPMEEQIREFAALNGLTSVRVVRVPSAAAALKDMDIFVHPSVDDAMPMAIAEALMCGIPCIVCRVGGCADLVRDGVEGFVIEPRRPEEILDRMERFLRMTDDELNAYRKRARTRYEEVCCPENVGREVADHYRALLAGIT